MEHASSLQHLASEEVHGAAVGCGVVRLVAVDADGVAVLLVSASRQRVAVGTETDAKELGADFLINYATHDFLDEVKKLTRRRMVEVVFEHVGAATWNKSIACLQRGGRLVTCGATTGPQVDIDLRTLFYKSISLLGSTMGSKSELFDILQWVEQGRLQPVLDRVLPLEKAAEAHQLLSDRKTFGNVVLTP